MKKLNDVEQKKVYEAEINFIIERMIHRKDKRYKITSEIDKETNENLLLHYYNEGNGMISLSLMLGITNQASATKDRQLLRNLL